MDLLTKEICQKIPALYSQEEKKPEDVKIIVKFFTPWSHWTWYATEADGFDNNGDIVSLATLPNWKELQDVRFFGFVAGDFPELGYFSLRELESVNGPFGLRIERDLHYGYEHTLKEVMDKVER